jgi:hypothetical protein
MIKCARKIKPNSEIKEVIVMIHTRIVHTITVWQK